ncbi:hypothetical protein [Aureispira sp. CCB-E]|uniref:hypothetical protein n=1 Tax=Aureispira sp. CCB-E TaxID=3051121 RepID=UPI00286875FF|nr:hypothetical protein [Aureispira sp. CCB-E]WMX12309.1 hypothetical protein QP953_15885 [Aureispira sp. CCB-E]
MNKKIKKTWSQLTIHSTGNGRFRKVEVRKSVWLVADFELNKIYIASGGFSKDFNSYMEFPNSKDFTENRFKYIYNCITGNDFDGYDRSPKRPDDLKERLPDICYALSGQKISTNDIEDEFNSLKMYNIYQALVQSKQCKE